MMPNWNPYKHDTRDYWEWECRRVSRRIDRRALVWRGEYKDYVEARARRIWWCGVKRRLIRSIFHNNGPYCGCGCRG